MHKAWYKWAPRMGKGSQAIEGGKYHAKFKPGQPHAPPMEEDVDLLGFPPSRANAFLVKVYNDQLHHNYGTQLDGGKKYDYMCQPHWKHLDAQLARWYTTPSGVAGGRFTAYLAEEQRWEWKRRWN